MTSETEVIRHFIGWDLDFVLGLFRDPQLRMSFDEELRLDPLDPEKIVNGKVIFEHKTPTGSQKLVFAVIDDEPIRPFVVIMKDDGTSEVLDIKNCWDDKCLYLFKEGNLLYGLSPEDIEQRLFEVLGPILNDYGATSFQS